MKFEVHKYGPSCRYEVHVFTDDGDKAGTMLFQNLHDTTPFLFNMNRTNIEVVADTCGVSVEELYIKVHEAVEDFNIEKLLPLKGETTILLNPRGVLKFICIGKGKDSKGWYVESDTQKKYYLCENTVLSHFYPKANSIRQFDLVKDENGNIGKVLFSNEKTVDVKWLYTKEYEGVEWKPDYESDVDPKKLKVIFRSQANDL